MHLASVDSMLLGTRLPACQGCHHVSRSAAMHPGLAHSRILRRNLSTRTQVMTGECCVVYTVRSTSSVFADWARQDKGLCKGNSSCLITPPATLFETRSTSSISFNYYWQHRDMDCLPLTTHNSCTRNVAGHFMRHCVYRDSLRSAFKAFIPVLGVPC